MDSLEHIQRPALDELAEMMAACLEPPELAYLAQRLAAHAGAELQRQEVLRRQETDVACHPRASQPPRFGS